MNNPKTIAAIAVAATLALGAGAASAVWPERICVNGNFAPGTVFLRLEAERIEKTGKQESSTLSETEYVDVNSGCYEVFDLTRKMWVERYVPKRADTGVTYYGRNLIARVAGPSGELYCATVFGHRSGYNVTEQLPADLSGTVNIHASC